MIKNSFQVLFSENFYAFFGNDSTKGIITSYERCYIIEEMNLDRRQDHEGMEL